MKPHQLRAIAFASLLPLVAIAQTGSPQPAASPSAAGNFPIPTVLPPVLDGTAAAAPSPILEAKAAAPAAALPSTVSSGTPAAAPSPVFEAKPLTPTAEFFDVIVKLAHKTVSEAKAATLSPVSSGTAASPSPVLQAKAAAPSPISGGTTAAPSPVLEAKALARTPALVGDTNAPNPPQSSPTPAQQATLIPSPESVVLPAKGDIRLNFQNASLADVLNYLSEAAGFIVLQEQPVNGTVTIVSHQPVSADEAVDLLNAVLVEKGYAAIRNGRILKIVSRADAQKRDLPVMAGSDPDKIPRKDQVVTQVLPLRYLDAAKLVENLRPLLSAEATITANESSNAIILGDTQTNIHRIAEIIHALDTSVSSISTIRVYQLQYADSKSLAGTLTQLFSSDSLHNGGATPQQQPQNGRMRGGNPMAAFFGGGGPGGPGGNGNTEASLTPAQVAAMKVIAVSDDPSNSVIVSAPDEVLVTITNIITRVDTPTMAITETRIFRLEHADPADLANIVNSLYGGAATPGNGNRNQPQQRAPQPNAQSSQRTLQEASVIAVADPRTNSLLVCAAKEALGKISDIVARIDTATMAVSETRIFPLQHADATDLAGTLNSLYGGTGTQPAAGNQRPNQQRQGQPNTQSGQRTSQEASVVVVADTRTNSLLVCAAGDMLGKVADVITRIDTPAMGVAETHIFPLLYADPTDLAGTLNSLYGSAGAQSGGAQRPGGQQRPSQPGAQGGQRALEEATVIAVPDVRTNAILVCAARDTLLKITDIITHIDVPFTGEGALTRIFQLQHADATDTATIVNSLYGSVGTPQPVNTNQRPGQPQQNTLSSSSPATLEASVLAVPDVRTNSILVCAAKDKLVKITDVITRIDTPITIAETRIFQLQHADATELANTLNTLYSNSGGPQSSAGASSAGQRPGTVSASLPRPPQQTTQAGSATHASQETTVVIVPDPRTNVVLVSAAHDMMEQVAMDIGRLDSTEAKRQHVYVYALQNADPDNVATILRGMFSNQAASSTTGAQPTSSMLNQRTSTGASSDVTSTINTNSTPGGSAP